MYLKSKSVNCKEKTMKRMTKQTKEMTLKRMGGDEFQFTVAAGSYYVDNKEIGVIIETACATILFDSFEEYWNTDMNKVFWEELLWKYSHEPITDIEASALSHIVEELRMESINGINQIYINDESWIDGLFELVI